MTVLINVHYLDLDGANRVLTLRFLNHNVGDDVFRRFVNELFALTENKIVDIVKVVSRFLSETQGDDYDFSDQDVADIFADDVFDFEDFTQPDIDYVFEDDSFDFDGFTQDDIDFILDR